MSDSTPKRRWLRFSLRTLVIFVLLCGSGMGLWFHSAPWHLEKTIHAHDHSAMTAYFSPDGKRIITAGHDNAARIWSVADGTMLAEFHSASQSNVFATFSRDGRLAAVAGYDKSVRVFETGSGTQLVEIKREPNLLNCAQFSPDGKTLLVACSAQSAFLYDEASGFRTPCAAFPTGRYDATHCAFSGDGRWVVVSTDRAAIVWQTSDSILSATLPHPDVVNWAVFSPDQRYIVTVCRDGSARLWQFDRQIVIRTFREQGQWSGIITAEFSPDGARILTASGCGDCTIWDVMTGGRLAVLRQDAGVQHVSFSSDGSRLAAASRDGKLSVWSRRRPEYWWGLAWLPEFWLTVVLAGAFAWSVWRDRRTL
ncbi:MAG: WD40 repeat domain-containing protein [Planctomycetota bacterium]|nr:WD40 repeat domain-containing protein [Planctomycetota bacterium]